MNRSRIPQIVIVSVALVCLATAWRTRGSNIGPTTAPADEQQQVQATAETKASKIVAVTAAPSKTKYARRIVTIPLEDASPDWAQITRSLDASAAKLGPQILNLAPEQVNDALQYRGEFGNDRANLIITVHLPDDQPARPAAREFADQLVSDLQEFVKTTTDTRVRNEAQPNEEALENARTTYEKSLKGLKELQFKLRDKTGRLDVSPQHIAEAAARLDQERLRLEIEQVAKNARREALSAAVADASKRMEQKVREDKVAAELAKVVEARERSLDRTRKAAAAGQASNDELDRATEALAEARAKLLERQQEASEQAGGDVLGGWNRELLTLSVDERELMARLDQVQGRLKSMRALVDSMDDLRHMQEELERSRAALADAQQRLKRTMEHLRQIEQNQRLLLREADDRRESPAATREQPARGPAADREREQAERERAADRDQAARDRAQQLEQRQRERAARQEEERQREQERSGAVAPEPAMPPSPPKAPTTKESTTRRPRIQRGDAQ